jgi:hypothetical protein
MPTVTVGRENSADIEIYYEDHGAGQPHGPHQSPVAVRRNRYDVTSLRS